MGPTCQFDWVNWALWPHMSMALGAIMGSGASGRRAQPELAQWAPVRCLRRGQRGDGKPGRTLADGRRRRRPVRDCVRRATEARTGRCGHRCGGAGEVGWARRVIGPGEGRSPKAESSWEGWTRSGPASRGARGHGEHAATAKRRRDRGGMGKTCSRGPVVVLKMSSGRRRSSGSR